MWCGNINSCCLKSFNATIFASCCSPAVDLLALCILFSQRLRPAVHRNPRDQVRIETLLSNANISGSHHASVLFWSLKAIVSKSLFSHHKKMRTDISKMLSHLRVCPWKGCGTSYSSDFLHQDVIFLITLVPATAICYVTAQSAGPPLERGSHHAQWTFS